MATANAALVEREAAVKKREDDVRAAHYVVEKPQAPGNRTPSCRAAHLGTKGPGCVKTQLGENCGELFSRLCPHNGPRKGFWFLPLRS